MPLLISTFHALRSLRRDRHFVAMAFLTLSAIVMGTVFYWLVEDLRLLDAVYFSVLTLTTVGYGDFTPQTDLGKLFTTFYVLLGVGLVLSFVTRVAGQAVVARVDHRPSRNGDHEDDEAPEPETSEQRRR